MKAASEHYLMTIWRDLRGRFDRVRTRGGNAEQLSLMLAELPADDQQPATTPEQEATE